MIRKSITCHSKTTFQVHISMTNSMSLSHKLDLITTTTSTYFYFYRYYNYYCLHQRDRTHQFLGIVSEKKNKKKKQHKRKSYVLHRYAAIKRLEVLKIISHHQHGLMQELF